MKAITVGAEVAEGAGSMLQLALLALPTTKIFY
jgi:hypothetical protein